MPNFNGKGPQGQGKLTGRGLGKCEGNSEFCDTPRFGRGRKCGSGSFNQNRGRGYGILNLGPSENEVESLKQRVADLEAKLNEQSK